MPVTVNLKVMESMSYFWEATLDREKVGEQYINSVAEMPEMKPLYSDDFSMESVRKLMSGISNREMFPWNQKEGRFWNNNMWMLEDMPLGRQMLSPVKTLNLDALNAKLGAKDLEVVIIPGHVDASYCDPGKITLNFFKIQVDLETGSLNFEGMPLVAYLESLLDRI